MEAISMKECLEKLVAKEDLSEEQAKGAMELIATGKADPVQIGAFLALMAAKGEKPEEIASFASVMLNHAIKVELGEKVLDIVGTGGDGHNTINISTSAAILIAACGVKVAKHGSTSVSSRSGSSDVLKELGIALLGPEHIKRCVEECGISFMFAPLFHPAMKHVVPVRKALQIRSVFNIMGPLMNPAGAKRMVLGVYSPHLLEIYADCVQRLGAEHALIVHCQGMDELAAVGPTQALEVTRDGIREISIDPQQMGIAKCEIKDLEGGSPLENAKRIREIFAGGEAAKGPIPDTICLNAGAALYVYGVAESIEAGFNQAKEKLVSGAALEMLDKFKEVSSRLEAQGN